MRKVIPYGLLILWIFILSGCADSTSDVTAVNKTITLNSGWTFSEAGKDLVNAATVPGTVHTDLLAINKIPYPFYRLNEHKLQWIDKKDWMYSTSFNIDSSDINASKIKLKFYGIDTYALIKLNGQELFEADNMFRTWEADVKNFLILGDNKLEVLLLSPIKKGLKLLEENGYPLPAVNDQSELGGLGNNKVSVFTRKAPYHYGWDWGPRMVTMGIWRPVELHVIKGSLIEDVYYKQSKINSKSAEVELKANLNIQADDNYTLVVRNKYTGKVVAKHSEKLTKGIHHLDLPLVIKNPKLWWPNGYGHQNLYAFNLQLIKKNRIIDQRVDYIGLRKVELVREPDSAGTSFYFKVNDVPIFAKGANYIPSDNFLPRVTKERYCELIKATADANMNMLRVWGGGIYEDDDFYSLCDKYGILVWQDFMFSCSMYPGNEEFLDNVTNEAIDNIKRLRNHASIALWCGNNEMDVAWNQGDTNAGWHWKERYSKEQQAKIWQAYDTIFHTILPNAVTQNDGTRNYWPSSPMADYGKHSNYSSTSGDMHYWGVWHGEESFDQFSQVKARFMSEYGFQSFPEFSTIREFTLPQDWSLQSKVMKSHQRSPQGNQKIKDYMHDYFPDPENFKAQLYMGQLLQAYGIKKAIDAHRINKPYTMGTLYWQLNDCWPTASWSSIDYFGRYKALHYSVKDAYKQTALAFSNKDGKIQLYVVNDDPELKTAQILVKQEDFLGNEIELFNGSVECSFEKSTPVYSLSLDQANNFASLDKSFLVASIKTKGERIDEELYYFVTPKELKLTQASPEITLEKMNNSETKIWIYSDRLVKNLAITLRNSDAFLSNNYFDIQPNETKEIIITCPDNEAIDLADIQTEMLNNFIAEK